MKINQNIVSYRSSPVAILLLVALAISLLYVLRPLLVPLLYGVFIAMILYPFCSKLESKGLGRVSSIVLALLLLSILFSGLLILILYQYRLFMDDFPVIREKLKPLLLSLFTWVERYLGTKPQADGEWLKGIVNYSGINIGSFISTGINLAGNALFNLLIIPLYAALILNSRTKFKAALLMIAGGLYKDHMDHILVRSVKIYSKYIKGMALVYLIVGILNSIGLLLLGVKYAILFGMLTAVMTIIPYFGIIISSLLPISMAWISTNSIYYPLGVVFVFSLVQYLEANFIFPYVVGEKVNVNILASLISVIAGGLLWGVSGMVLFLPLTAILKIIADETEEWKVVSILLGNGVDQKEKSKT